MSSRRSIAGVIRSLLGLDQTDEAVQQLQRGRIRAKLK
jgi:hypothetical protein